MTTALTFDGELAIETGIPLAQLRLGDTVLGLPDPDDPAAPRTTHVVVATLDRYHIPTEDPTRIERFLTKVGAERLLAGAKVEGILVAGTHGPGLFALEDTPALDRVLLRG